MNSTEEIRKPKSKEPALIQAVKEENLEKIVDLLAQNADPNEPGAYGRTPIIALFTQRKKNFGGKDVILPFLSDDALEIAEVLIEAGADVSIRDEFYYSAKDYLFENHVNRSMERKPQDLEYERKRELGWKEYVDGIRENRNDFFLKRDEYSNKHPLYVSYEETRKRRELKENLRQEMDKMNWAFPLVGEEYADEFIPTETPDTHTKWKKRYYVEAEENMAYPEVYRLLMETEALQKSIGVRDKRTKVQPAPSVQKTQPVQPAQPAPSASPASPAPLVPSAPPVQSVPVLEVDAKKFPSFSVKEDTQKITSFKLTDMAFAKKNITINVKES